jgi:hypothetical protein
MPHDLRKINEIKATLVRKKQRKKGEKKPSVVEKSKQLQSKVALQLVV